MEMRIDYMLPTTISEVCMCRPGAEKLSSVKGLGICSYELDGKLYVVKKIYDDIMAKRVKH